MAKTSHVEAAADGDDWLVVPCESHASVKVEPEDDGSVEETQTLNQGRLQTEPEPDNVAVQSFQPENRAFYQLLMWHSGLEEPLEVQDGNQKPLLVIVDKNCSMKELQKIVQEMVVTQPQLQELLPGVTMENVGDTIQVCDRLDDKTPWKSHQFDEEPKELIDSENNGEFADVESCNNNYVDGLLFASPTMVLDKSELHQLLVETRFLGTNGEGLTDWRHGRFYSDIQENAWRFQLQIGQLIDALDTDKRWYESRVVDMDAGRVKVHYRGWTSKWDEWLHRTSLHLAPLHTNVSNWRDFQIGDEVMVGAVVAGKKYPEWRNACVTARGNAKANGSFQIELDTDGCLCWMDAQDELLCPKGTHKAINAGVKNVAAVLAAPPSLLPNYFELPDEPPRPPACSDEIESMSDMMHDMEVIDGDDWCVVGSDSEKEYDDAEGEGITEDNNQTALGDATYNSSETNNPSVTASTEYSAVSRDGDFSGGVDGQVPPTPSEMIPLPLELLEENSKDENWRFQLEIGELIDALDTDNVWYESRVVAMSSTLVKLHYRGWTSKWDEWVERTSTRIAPLHTKVRNWRAFKVYDEVLVGRNVPSKKYPEWRNAVVTVVAREVDGPLRIEVEIDGSKMWLDAQDELLCPPGTHKAVNASMLTPSSSLF